MKSLRWLFLALALYHPQASAQTGPGSPLTPAYADWIDWSKRPHALRSLPIKENADGLSKEFLSQIEQSWEGDSEKMLCPDPARLTRVYRSPGSGKTTIRYCLRTIDHFREFRRAFELLTIVQSKKFKDDTLFEILDDYSTYQLKIIHNDILKNDYIAFCTVEFYIYVSIWGHNEASKCHAQKTVAKYKAGFANALHTGFFMPASVLAETKRLHGYQTSKEIIDTHFQAANNDEWHMMWIFPNLHELGHIALCHVATANEADCMRKSSRHIRGSSEEIAADAWALSTLGKLYRDKPGEIMANINVMLTYQVFSAMVSADIENLDSPQFRRVAAMNPEFKRAIEQWIRSAELSPELRKELKRLIRDETR